MIFRMAKWVYTFFSVSFVTVLDCPFWTTTGDIFLLAPVSLKEIAFGILPKFIFLEIMNKYSLSCTGCRLQFFF